MRRTTVGVGIGLTGALAFGAYLLGSTHEAVNSAVERPRPAQVDSSVVAEDDKVSVSQERADASGTERSRAQSNDQGQNSAFEGKAKLSSGAPPVPSRVLPALPSEQGITLRAPSKTLPGPVTEN